MGSATKFIAIAVVLLVCSVTMADCACRCVDDYAGDECPHACCQATVHIAHLMDFSLCHQKYSFSHNWLLPHIFPEDVFQPPRMTA
jgi:hypothetical protein